MVTRTLAFAGVIAAGMLGVPGAATATPAPTQGAADLVVSGVVRQQLQSTAGAAAAVTGISHSQIGLQWNPAQGIDQGTVQHWQVASKAVTDARGIFALQLAPTPQLREAAARNDGWINFDLIAATSSGDAQVVAVSRKLDANGWSGGGRAEFAPTTPVSVTLQYNAQGQLTNGLHRTAGARPQTVSPDDNCPVDVVATSNASTRIGDFHNSLGMTGTWEYGTTADSDIDAGFSSSGSNWSIDGSVHIGNSTGSYEMHSTPYNYDKYIRTNFKYENLYHHGGCYPYYAPAYYELKAVEWTGGAQDDGYTFNSCYAAPESNYQTVETPGTIGKSSTRATKIGFAIDVFGVRLGADSGYSTHMDLSWNISKDELFCGQKDYWTGSPGVIYNQPLT